MPRFSMPASTKTGSSRRERLPHRRGGTGRSVTDRLVEGRRTGVRTLKTVARGADGFESLDAFWASARIEEEEDESESDVSMSQSEASESESEKGADEESPQLSKKLTFSPDKAPAPAPVAQSPLSDGGNDAPQYPSDDEPMAGGFDPNDEPMVPEADSESDTGSHINSPIPEVNQTPAKPTPKPKAKAKGKGKGKAKAKAATKGKGKGKAKATTKNAKATPRRGRKRAASALDDDDDSKGSDGEHDYQEDVPMDSPEQTPLPSRQSKKGKAKGRGRGRSGKIVGGKRARMSSPETPGVTQADIDRAAAQPAHEIEAIVDTRSRRKRWKPLAFWKGERAVYERDRNTALPEVKKAETAGITSPVLDLVLKRRAKASKRAARARAKSNKSNSRKKKQAVSDDDSDGEARSAALKPMRKPRGFVESDVLVYKHHDCIIRHDQVECSNLPRNEQDADFPGEALAGGTMRFEGFTSGMISLAPRAMKEVESSQTHTMVFAITAGQPKSVGVKLAVENQDDERTYLLSPSDQVLVPPHTHYELKNYSATETARLTFFVLTRDNDGSESEEDDEEDD